MTAPGLGVYQVEFVGRYASVQAVRTLKTVADDAEQAVARAKRHARREGMAWVRLVGVRMIQGVDVL